MTDVVSRLTASLSDRYRLDRELGAGGMAKVYLAHDLKHDRDVAIKVLHPDLGAALGAERFLSEIRTTARLQHPHILPLLDSGEADGLLYYVMPLVTGETLRARLEREQQLPIADAVRIAREVASALDYAHRQNIIHRDIKPENVLLHDGQAIVADFGIALAVQTAGGARMTQTGLSLGTPQYMSPEQAMGERTVDARSDVYALGAVTYEMLVGEPPFSGASAHAIVARILSERPTALCTLRDTVPDPVERAVLQALAKLPADRFATARAFADALAPATPSGAQVAPTSAAQPPARRRGAWVAYAVGVAGMLAGAAGWLQSRRAPESTDVTRFVVPLRDSVPLALGMKFGVGTLADGRRLGRPDVPAFALSPDGQTIVLAATRIDANATASRRLYRRRLDDERLIPIPGTDSAFAPFFAPSGRAVGFFVGRSLRSVTLNGDSARRIADGLGTELAGVASGMGVWGADGTIIIGSPVGLWEVPAGGGAARRIPLPDDSATARIFPKVSAPTLAAGGTRVIFHTHPAWDPRRSALRMLDRATGTVTTVLENAMHGTVVGDSLLLFMRDGALLAVRFDVRAGKVIGEPVTVDDGIAQALYMPNTALESGVAQYAVSSRGDLVVAYGGAYPTQLTDVVVRAPDGRVRRLALPGAQYGFVRGAPVGDRLLVSERRGIGKTGISLVDLQREVLTPLDLPGFSVGRPVWHPDGRQFVYESDATEPTTAPDARNFYVGRVDGSAPPERLTTGGKAERPAAWLADGTVVYVVASGGLTSTIWLRSPDGSLRPWLNSGARESFPAPSPDGTRMAYVSNGLVFVRSFPGPGSAVTVSDVGTTEPAWSPDGRQLYFVATGGSSTTPTRSLMVADVGPGTPALIGRARTVMASFPARPQFSVRTWDVLPDGGLVMIVPSDTSALAEFNSAVISELHAAQRALRGLRFNATVSSPKR